MSAKLAERDDPTGFDTTTATVKQFVDFCERLELVEGFKGRTGKFPKREASKECKRLHKKARHTENTGQKRNHRHNTFDSGFYYMYHGKDKGHNAKDCTVLKQQARAMRGQHNAQKYLEKKNFQAKKEFAAMIGEVTE